MITSKYISKFIVVIVTVAVVICILAMEYSKELTEAFGGTVVTMRYESELFDTDEIIQIDIQMADEKWEQMLADASREEYISCDVVVNGEKIQNVGIRPKGNTSLSAIVMNPDTDRFSLKLEFDRYVEGQTCLGLDKLILNNNYADATNMKEAVIYDMFQYLGADASLYNYAKISVNGEYWGIYLALEAIEDSFLLRNYGAEDGELYKPESMEMGGGHSGHRKDEFFGKNMEMMPSRGEKSAGSGGADLKYVDDEPDSYATIWEGGVTDTGNSDHRRVITALKNINNGNNLEEYLDTENVLKYMAVHTFAVNMDSLSGNMAHNYYLYEHDGKLNILPWDYNLSFGGMNRGQSGDAEDMVNYAIDTPFQGTDFFDALLEDEAYLSKYHAYLQQLVEEYVFGGKFEEVYNRIRNQIDELVETDPTAFYSYEEYEIGAEMLYQTVMLRAESILGQLDKTIPSTDAGQKEDAANLIDASDIDVSAMGTSDMGGFNGPEREDRFSGDFEPPDRMEHPPKEEVPPK